ncbi:MAG: DNA polymerase IV [Chloroflexota bacterium]
MLGWEFQYNGLVTLRPNRYILHADMDAFYASVERLDDPSLEGKPLVVGAPPEQRGVVAAASYEARRYGIHSAMPMRTALRLCPSLVRVSPRFDRYREVSNRVMGIFRDVTPIMESVSLDEGYLDVTEKASTGNVNLLAFDLKARVSRETGLVVTIGGGTSKTVAKVASRLAKPNGLLLVRPGDEAAFLAPLEIDRLPGVGPRSATVLKERGVKTLGELSACDEVWLRQTFGRRGRELRERATGIDYSPVTPYRETRSVSEETTMAEDVGDESVLLETARELAAGVATRLKELGLMGRTVSIKLRLADFRTFTRQTVNVKRKAAHRDGEKAAHPLVRVKPPFA